MCDEGDIARKALVDRLLDSDAGYQSVQVLLDFSDIDQSNDDSAGGVEDQFAVSEVVSNRKREIEQMHLKQ